jgi:hypothetical protein
MDSLERTPPSPMLSTPTTAAAPDPAMPSCCPTASFPAEMVRSWIRDRRVLAGAGLAVAGSGLAFGWDWLIAVGIAPLIVSAAPCLLMCALGLCMMGRGHQASPGKPETAAGAGQSDRAGRIVMTRGIRVFLACAIALLVIGAGGLAALLLVPMAPKVTNSMVGALGGPFTLTATDGRAVTDQTYRGKWGSDLFRLYLVP